jgi:hypothetical protein
MEGKASFSIVGKVESVDIINNDSKGLMCRARIKYKNNKYLNVIAFRENASKFEGLENQFVIVDGYMNEKSKVIDNMQIQEISLIATLVMAIADNPELNEDEVLDQIQKPQKSLFEERAERAKKLFTS